MSDSVCKEENYNAVYRRDVEKLRNFIYYKCGDLDEANDLVQEAFVRLWQKCKDVLLEKVTPFLYTVSQRLFIDKVRKDKVVLNFQKTVSESVNKEDPHFLLQSNEFKAKIELAISDLPEGQREVFLMNRIDKRTFKEIAEILGVSQTAVENRMSKALVKLRSKIEEFKTYNI